MLASPRLQHYRGPSAQLIESRRAGGGSPAACHRKPQPQCLSFCPLAGSLHPSRRTACGRNSPFSRFVTFRRRTSGSRPRVRCMVTRAAVSMPMGAKGPPWWELGTRAISGRFVQNCHSSDSKGADHGWRGVAVVRRNRRSVAVVRFFDLQIDKVAVSTVRIAQHAHVPTVRMVHDCKWPPASCTRRFLFVLHGRRDTIRFARFFNLGVHEAPRLQLKHARPRIDGPGFKIHDPPRSCGRLGSISGATVQ